MSSLPSGGRSSSIAVRRSCPRRLSRPTSTVELVRAAVEACYLVTSHVLMVPEALAVARVAGTTCESVTSGGGHWSRQRWFSPIGPRCTTTAAPAVRSGSSPGSSEAPWPAWTPFGTLRSRVRSRLPDQSPPAPVAIARTTRSTSRSAVDQLDTEMRVNEVPCQVVPPVHAHPTAAPTRRRGSCVRRHRSGRGPGSTPRR